MVNLAIYTHKIIPRGFSMEMETEIDEKEMCSWSTAIGHKRIQSQAHWVLEVNPLLDGGGGGAWRIRCPWKGFKAKDLDRTLGEGTLLMKENCVVIYMP